MPIILFKSADIIDTPRLRRNSLSRIGVRQEMVYIMYVGIWIWFGSMHSRPLLILTFAEGKPDHPGKPVLKANYGQLWLLAEGVEPIPVLKTMQPSEWIQTDLAHIHLATSIATWFTCRSHSSTLYLCCIPQETHVHSIIIYLLKSINKNIFNHKLL